MDDQKQGKRFYSAPWARPTVVAFEQALLVTTTRLTMTVDELENVNADDPLDQKVGSDMYFEF
jgi:hypothetical protein